MYDVDFSTHSDIKFNEDGSLYYGECDAKLFSENIRRLMHKNKYTWQQAIAVTFSECEKGKAFVEGEESN